MARVPKHPSKRSYVLSHMFQRHHEMARLVMLGFSNGEIAAALNCTPQNVSDCRNSPIFQSKLAFLSGNRDEAAIDVAKSLRDEAPASLKLLVSARDSEDVDLKLRTVLARDLLDRAGYSKVTRVEGRIAHGHFVQDADHLASIKARAREARENMQVPEASEPTKRLEMENDPQIEAISPATNAPVGVYVGGDGSD